MKSKHRTKLGKLDVILKKPHSKQIEMTCIKYTTMDTNRQGRNGNGNSGRRKNNKQNKGLAGGKDTKKPWTEESE